jgi:tetratricopeptide (TPR) repeat protein
MIIARPIVLSLKGRCLRSLKLILLGFLLFAAAPVCGQEDIHYFNLGLESSRTRKKIEYFTKALELNPDLAVVYEKRGILLYFQKEYLRAIQDFQKYLELAPAKSETYRMLGLAYLGSQSYEPAINIFTGMIETEPKCTVAYANRAEAYRLSGQYDEAIRDATRVINYKADPITKVAAYTTRAKVYWKIGRNELAAEDVRAAVIVDPRNWFRDWFRYASPDDMRRAAPFLIIAIAFALIFGLKLRPPKKDD